MLVVLLLIAPAESGCLAPCNCPSSSGLTFSFPAELNVQLAATGDACSCWPVCEQRGDGGGCTQYDVALTHTGSCQLDGECRRRSRNERRRDCRRVGPRLLLHRGGG